MTTSNTRELREGRAERDRYDAEIGRKQLSRRRVLTAGAALSLIATGGLGALLGACGDDSGATPTGTTTGGAPAGTGTRATAAPFAGVTGDWDTTGTPPYKRGLPDEVAKPDPAWKQYPWVYKYGPWRYDWNVPVTRGGHEVTGSRGVPPANYDLMRGSIYAQAGSNKMYNAGLREGSNLLTPAVEPDLVQGESHTPDYTSWTLQAAREREVPQQATGQRPPDDGRRRGLLLQAAHRQ